MQIWERQIHAIPKENITQQKELIQHRNNWYEKVRNSREGIKEVIKENIEKLFADDAIILYGGNASGHNGKCTSVATENTINISGMKITLKEFAKHLPKIEMSEKVSNETDNNGMLTDESSFAHFDGVGKKIEII